MNKKVIIAICIVILVLIIGAFTWIKLNNTFDKSNPIIFEKGSNDNYSYIIYQGKEYVPYCAYSPKERDCYLGYVGEDKQDEVYTVKWYSEEEWLINLLDTGATKECMLYKEKNITDIPEGLSSEYEWNSSTNVSEDKKNYNDDLQIAYANESDKENSNFIYSNDIESNEYNWNQYIVENHTILKNMPEIDFSKFENLGDDFYCLKITDYETYNEYSEKYNLKKLDESDFNSIFVEIIVRKSSDNTIKYNDMIEGYEYVTNENSYTFPVTIGGMLDVDENFKYPCLVAYFPNYYNKHFDNFYFKVIVQNENMNISKDKALQIAQNYLSNLTYKGCGNFTYMDYERFIQTYGNNFLNTEDKEHPVEDTKEVYTVWSVSAYSKDDPCTWANVYVDIVTGKIVGGALNYATD